MPRGDGTGPMGGGPFTGRGMGRCFAGGMAGFRFMAGRGRGCGRGFGRWLGGGVYPRAEDYGKSEKELLREEIKYLQSKVEAIEAAEKTAEEQ